MSHIRSASRASLSYAARDEQRARSKGPWTRGRGAGWSSVGAARRRRGARWAEPRRPLRAVARAPGGRRAWAPGAGARTSPAPRRRALRARSRGISGAARPWRRALRARTGRLSRSWRCPLRARGRVSAASGAGRRRRRSAVAAAGAGLPAVWAAPRAVRWTAARRARAGLAGRRSGGRLAGCRRGARRAAAHPPRRGGAAALGAWVLRDGDAVHEARVPPAHRRQRGAR